MWRSVPLKTGTSGPTLSNLNKYLGLMEIAQEDILIPDSERILDYMIRDGANTASDEMLFRLIDDICHLMAKNEFSELEKILGYRGLPAIAPEHLLAILRTTFPYRHTLLGWEDFKDRVRGELTSRSLEVEAMMYGL